MRTAYVMTGGSLKGICAQTAILMVLEELGIRPDAIIGTSAGAIVGAMYASGMHPYDIRNAITDMTKKDYIDPDKWGLAYALMPWRLGKGFTGLYKGKALTKWLKKILDNKTFEDCRYPLYITATNVSRGIPAIFHKGSSIRKGSLADAARASSSIPFVYRPHNIDGQFYVDGGAVNNVPLDEMIDLYPGMDRYIILSSLNLEKTIPQIDQWKDKRWAIFRLLKKIAEAVAEEQFKENLETHGNTDAEVVRFNLRGLNIGFDDVHLAGQCIDQAHEMALVKANELGLREEVT